MSPPPTLSIAAQRQSIPEMHAFVEAVCREHALPGNTCHHLMLAIEEACANIIEHGYAGMEPGSIRVKMRVEPRRVVVTVTDRGWSFDPTGCPPPDLESDCEHRPIGGLGIYFMKQLMDEVRYRSDRRGGNRLTLVKYLPVETGGKLSARAQTDG
ncbi:MAG: ATP-binding protein [Chloroflexota bacterium]